MAKLFVHCKILYSYICTYILRNILQRHAFNVYVQAAFFELLLLFILLSSVYRDLISISNIENTRYRVFVTKMAIFDKSRFGQKGDHRGVIDHRSIIGATLVLDSMLDFRQW